jgi:hypothetical protein
MDNDSEKKSSEVAAAADKPAQADAEFSVDERFSGHSVTGENSIPEEASVTVLAEIKAQMKNLASSVDGLSRKNSNVSETTARAITELRSRSEIFEKSVSQISRGNKNTLLLITIIAVLGLGMLSVISVFLVFELRKTRSVFNSFESKISEVSPIASQLTQVLNEISGLSKSQESVQLAITQFDKNFESNLNKTSPEKQFQAIEKMMIAQGNRLTRLEQEIQQTKSFSKKSDISVLRKEMESAFRAQREWAEAAAKKSVTSAADMRPVDARPQYPKPENRQSVSTP